MNSHVRARSVKRAMMLTDFGVLAELARVLPKRNRYGFINTQELVLELTDFGVTTRGEFRKLMLKHRKRLIEIDRTPLNAMEQRLFAEDYGADVVREFQRRHYWYSWEALVRIALELEFGEHYEAYARRRDGIAS